MIEIGPNLLEAIRAIAICVAALGTFAALRSRR